jgi:hypothetical protein
VNIVGSVDINALSKLSGSFGIPKIDSNMFGGQKKPATKSPRPKQETKRDQEKDDDEGEN